jgi:RNA 3'-terminal phosphate cyclase (ATP)
MAAAGSLIVIDGAHGEGGGALIRMALTMSALTQQPIRVDHVRAGTNYPGLDIEDITLARTLARSCAAETPGLEFGASTFTFLPSRPPAALKERLDIAAEGSNRVPNSNVLLNSLIPILARSGAYSQLSLSGETYGSHSLGFDYFANVTLGAFRRMGLHAFADQIHAGFGRDGGGDVSLEIEPSVVQGVQWKQRGELIAARGVISIGELPMTVAHRGLAHLTNLGINAKIPIDIEIVGVETRRPGVSVTMWAEYENGFGGATAIGAKGIRIEAVAQAAFEDAFEWIKSDASMDPFLADQILPATIIAESESVFTVSRLTTRLLTLIWVIKQFLPIHITVKGKEGEPGQITVRR